MDWRESVLFHAKSSEGYISRRNIESLLSQGLNSYDDSIERLNTLVEDNYIERINSKEFSWKLTEKGHLEITPFFNAAKDLMQDVELKLEVIVKMTSIELKGGITGIYFTYTEGLHMFRFHPYGRNEEVSILCQLPSLNDYTIECKYNNIYVSKEVLGKTMFLENIVLAHIDMIDQCGKGTALGSSNQSNKW